MSRSTRIWAGLYGVAFHLIAVAVAYGVALRNQASISARFWWMTVPPLLVAAFVVYALLVGSYLPKRPATRPKSAVLYDSVVGMFAELGIAVATTVLYALGAARAAAGGGGAGGYLADAAATALFAFLWTFGSFFTQILVVGNAAGLVGWVVLKKLADRRAKAKAA